MIFKKRKIVIISGERIASYNLSVKMQCCALALFATLIGLGAQSALSPVAGPMIAAQQPSAFELEELLPTERSAPTNATESDMATAPQEPQKPTISPTEIAAIKRIKVLEEELASTSERLKNMVMLAESLSLVADATPGGKRYGFSKTGIPVPHLKNERGTAPLPPHERSALEYRETELYARLRDGIKNRIANIGEGLSHISEKYIVDGTLKDVRKGETAQGGPYVPEDFSTATEAFDISSQLVSLATVRDRLAALPIGRPIADYRITGHYGPRKDPINGRRATHHGIDISGGHGAKVYATAGGVVKRAGRLGAYGNFIEITHPNGYSTRFGHLQKIHVKAGQRVKQGQLIGRQGNTGRSTGSHLHYEVRYRNVAVNPYNFLKAGRYVF